MERAGLGESRHCGWRGRLQRWCGGVVVLSVHDRDVFFETAFRIAGGRKRWLEWACICLHSACMDGHMGTESEPHSRPSPHQLALFSCQAGLARITAKTIEKISHELDKSCRPGALLLARAVASATHHLCGRWLVVAGPQLTPHLSLSAPAHATLARKQRDRDPVPLVFSSTPHRRRIPR
jgi:hypothetical protein